VGKVRKSAEDQIIISLTVYTLYISTANISNACH